MAYLELSPADPRAVGPYRVLGRLDTGGMGQVYLAQSPAGRAVALKVISAELAADPRFRALFSQGVVAARRVSGEFTAPVVSADLEGPRPWVATAYVPGPTLGRLVAGQGPLPGPLLVALGAALAEGLREIHAAGVVHRDLKPSNVILGGDGPRIVDFGIAVTVGATVRAGEARIVGTPGYMAPEQVYGAAAGPASDVFSLGAVLAFAATGRAPFASGDFVRTLYAVVNSEPDLAAVPELIRPVVTRCLAKDAAARPPAAELSAAFDLLAASEFGLAPTALRGVMTAIPGWGGRNAAGDAAAPVSLAGWSTTATAPAAVPAPPRYREPPTGAAAPAAAPPPPPYEEPPTGPAPAAVPPPPLEERWSTVDTEPAAVPPPPQREEWSTVDVEPTPIPPPAPPHPGPEVPSGVEPDDAGDDDFDPVTGLAREPAAGSAAPWAPAQAAPPPFAAEQAYPAAGDDEEGAESGLWQQPSYPVTRGGPAAGYGGPAPAQAPAVPAPEPAARYLTGILPERAPADARLSLLVQVTLRRGANPAAALKNFAVPPTGTTLTISVSAPGLLPLGDLEQDLFVPYAADSEPIRFGFVTGPAGLHSVVVRAFAQGTFLGELTLQISVEPGAALEEGRGKIAALAGLAAEPGEVTLQVSRTDEDRYSFQLIGEEWNRVEVTRRLAGDPTQVVGLIVEELRAMSANESRFASPALVRNRIRNLGAQLWADVVPEAIRRQFWAQGDRIRLFTIASDMDTVPWELLYPADGDNDNGFLVEQFPVVRRVYGQGRTRVLRLDSGAAYVVPPGSPANAMAEVAGVRDIFPARVRNRGVCASLDGFTGLLDAAPSVLHFACHNAFTEQSGSVIALEGGPLRPSDLAIAVQRKELAGISPLVFLNACRTAGDIAGLTQLMGWARQFMGAGAGAFVGSLWAVRSASAKTFAEAFYRALVSDGLPLGTASLRARQEIAGDPGDPTWLAYTVYGNPSAAIDLEPAR